MIKPLLLVGLGGGAGSIVRYLCQKWIYQLYPHPFPWGTFLVNITGCFLIGIFWGWMLKAISFTDDFRLLLITGFCGGFTTFSAFTLESINLIKEQRLTIMYIYIVSSVATGLLATYAGIRLLK